MKKRGGGIPPIKMHGVQDKRVAGRAFCKLLKGMGIDDGKSGLLCVCWRGNGVEMEEGGTPSVVMKRLRNRLI